MLYVYIEKATAQVFFAMIFESNLEKRERKKMAYITGIFLLLNLRLGIRMINLNIRKHVVYVRTSV